MRKLLPAAVLMGTLAAMSAFALDPGRLTTLTFRNASGTGIQAIFLRQANSAFWGPDLLKPGSSLGDGASISFPVYFLRFVFRFDVLATDDKGRRLELVRQQVTDENPQTIVLTAGETGETPPDLVTLNIRNDTGTVLHRLFVAPLDAGSSVPDLLAKTSIPQGGSRGVLVPVLKEGMQYAVMAADGEEREFISSVSIDPAEGLASGITLKADDMRQGTGD